MSSTNIRSYNKAVLAHKKMKDLKVGERAVVFFFPKPRPGASKQEFRFPYGGKVTDVYVSCSSTGTGNTVLHVEKCSQADFDTTPVWSRVTEDIVLESGEKSTNTSLSPIVFADDILQENDHIRLYISEVGAGLDGLTVEVFINIE